MTRIKTDSTAPNVPAPAAEAESGAWSIHGPLRVRTTAPERRRAGRVFQAGHPVALAPDALSADELAALHADPLLHVEVVDA